LGLRVRCLGNYKGMVLLSPKFDPKTPIKRHPPEIGEFLLIIL